MCLQELLEFWLRIQRGNEPDMLRFQDSVRKVAALSQDIKHMSILLDVLVAEVCQLELCTAELHSSTDQICYVLQKF